MLKEQEILNRISIVNVKNKLKLYEVCTLGDVIYVRCPFCNSENGTMKLNTSNNSYICKNCNVRGYSIGLYARYNGITNQEAYGCLLNDKTYVKNNLKNSIIINTRKNDNDLDEVYQAFLQMLNLSSEHTMKLLELGFSIEEIDEIGFKTIPNNESEVIRICQALISEGFELSGIPGFYQNKKFKWIFKIHKGIFIPIRHNCKIIAIRIHLDSVYSIDTSNIWFSSSSQNNGTKASNNIMILLPKKNLIEILNKKQNTNDIIIASEMLLAYKIHAKYNDKIVIRSSKCDN